MKKFLFTTLFTDDLGLITRSLPIARELADRGHDVAYCNPANAPTKLIEGAGIQNLPLDIQVIPTVMPPPTPKVWNMNHFAAAMGCLDENFVRGVCDALKTVIADYEADIIVDAWNPWSCIAARIFNKPLVTITQADLHPSNKGFIWWEEPPADIPTPIPGINNILAEHGHPAISKVEDLLVGDLTLVLGIPETDPLPEGTNATYVGPILWQQSDAKLPDPINSLDQEVPVIWVYTGNPQYSPEPMWGDSAVVLRACIEALGKEEVQVVLSTGHHALPEKSSDLPANFVFKQFVPGLAMAERSDLLIHHGGYGSCQTGLYTGTPAVIIPTYSERESNARRIAAAGAGEFILPTVDAAGIKHVTPKEVREKVKLVLSEPSYTQKARAISEKMKVFGGVSQAAALIEKFAANL
jgi:UDP:flavonoid glycosyltransferase YjiC (YdhE family)